MDAVVGTHALIRRFRSTRSGSAWIPLRSVHSKGCLRERKEPQGIANHAHAGRRQSLLQASGVIDSDLDAPAGDRGCPRFAPIPCVPNDLRQPHWRPGHPPRPAPPGTATRRLASSRCSRCIRGPRKPVLDILRHIGLQPAGVSVANGIDLVMHSSTDLQVPKRSLIGLL